MTVRLNIGAGKYPLKDFENYDLPEFDIRDEWALESNYADYIHMSHVIEHVTRDQAFRVLGQARRVLKPGGTLHIATPNMDKFIDCHLSGDFGPLEGYRWTDLNMLLGGDKENDSLASDKDFHKYMYCYASLHWTLKRVGFSEAWMTSWNQHDTPQYYPISLYVDAVK